MLVKCPVCQAEYQLEPGKYKCECGATFFVLEDGGVSLSDPGTAAGNSRTNAADPDRTMAPQTRHDQSKSAEPSFDPERTVPNIRIRHERGELQPGDVILDRYELLEKLGSGAMGVVFKCRDRISGVEYALKMVPPELVRDAEAMEDVRENFRLVHGLKHQNIASMDFLDRDEYGSYFLIMEYVHGESLTPWIKKKWRSGRPDPAEVVHIVKQIAAALDYAHSQQILHRDIKPANVMVDEQGNVKVLDFGLASKIRSTMTALSVTTSNTSGTPHYLSPEQFKGKYPGPASDQYALGVLTYQMFAGHLPFEADDFNVLHAAVVNEEPDPIGGIPTVIELALQRVLRKDPKKRFETCTAFANTLAAGLPAPILRESKASKNADKIPNPTKPPKKATPPTGKSILCHLLQVINPPQKTTASAVDQELKLQPSKGKKAAAPAEIQLSDSVETDRWKWLAFHLKSWSFLLLVVVLIDGSFWMKDLFLWEYCCTIGGLSVVFAWACCRKIDGIRLSPCFVIAACALLIFLPLFFLYFCSRYSISNSVVTKGLILSEFFIIPLAYSLEPLKKCKCRMMDVLTIFFASVTGSFLLENFMQPPRLLGELILVDCVRSLFMAFFLILWLKYRHQPLPTYGLCYGFITGLGTVVCFTILSFTFAVSFRPLFSVLTAFIGCSIVGILTGHCLNRDGRIKWKKCATIPPLIIGIITVSSLVKEHYYFDTPSWGEVYLAAWPILFEYVVFYVMEWALLRKT